MITTRNILTKSKMCFKRVLYRALFTTPRSVLDLFVSIIPIFTLGLYDPSFNHYRNTIHSIWADRISSKCSGIKEYVDNYKNS